MDTDEGSITHGIGLIEAGDRTAAQPLWEADFRRLVALARAQLHATSRRVADEEDVALFAAGEPPGSGLQIYREMFSLRLRGSGLIRRVP
jgi:acetyl esterase/lipase